MRIKEIARRLLALEGGGSPGQRLLVGDGTNGTLELPDGVEASGPTGFYIQNGRVYAFGEVVVDVATYPNLGNDGAPIVPALPEGYKPHPHEFIDGYSTNFWLMARNGIDNNDPDASVGLYYYEDETHDFDGWYVNHANRYGTPAANFLRVYFVGINFPVA